jgi:hypothetical protein
VALRAPETLSAPERSTTRRMTLFDSQAGEEVTLARSARISAPVSRYLSASASAELPIGALDSGLAIGQSERVEIKWSSQRTDE